MGCSPIRHGRMVPLPPRLTKAEEACFRAEVAPKKFRRSMAAIETLHADSDDFWERNFKEKVKDTAKR